jgi:hypothetical protein
MENPTNTSMPEQTPASEPVNVSKPQPFNWLKKVNKKVLGIVAIILVVLALLYYYKGLFVAAIVDGHPIARLSVIHAIEQASGKAELDKLIQARLINDAADKQKITISSDDTNNELKKYETQLQAQNVTLTDALSQQGITLDQLKDDIVLELKLEKLLADKIAVTDDDINAYIKANNITIPAGQDAQIKAQIKSQLTQQKLSQQAATYIAELRTKAHIQTFVNY